MPNGGSENIYKAEQIIIRYDGLDIELNKLLRFNTTDHNFKNFSC